jgi:DNA-binding CsgD family transcriptional regulator
MDVAQIVSVVVLFFSLATLVVYLLRKQSTELRDLIFRLSQRTEAEHREDVPKERRSTEDSGTGMWNEGRRRKSLEDQALEWSKSALDLNHYERRIVELLIREPGKSRKEVAAELKVSLSTLDKCYERVYLKLDVRTKEEALKALLVRGIR